MQFIKNGPDIPERLLQIHEEGNVVFFCGAGVSMPAGLPDFKNLVTNLYENLGVTPNSVQQAALAAKQYDTAIGLLEADYVGGRSAVRRKLADILTSAHTSPKATSTHEALLTLGKCRNGKLHLITTNFDRLFEDVIDKKELIVRTYKAPLLPVPKAQWDGLVYLHGLVPSSLEDNDLDSLVLSSGDFGLAYLTERWAARFVSELFRHYTVCFVGYSLNDPVLRYMMDALAADWQRGESTREMYAFCSYPKGKENACKAEWGAKNVTPILYPQNKAHGYLHKTLLSWSETYRDGVRGKEQIVLKEAISNPLIRTKEDDFIGRVLWALSDESGLPSGRFAGLDPVPSLDWLEPFSENKYRHDDLIRFGVPPKPKRNDRLVFSLIRRPTPYDCAPFMSLVDWGTTCKWDRVMPQMARWLIRHLGDPKLVLWLAKQGGQLHDDFVWLIEHRLDELSKLERDGRADELTRIRSSAANAIPGSMLRLVWGLFLAGRHKPSVHNLDLFRWQQRFHRDGLTPSLRMAFRELLRPCIELREPFRRTDGVGGEQEPKNLKEIIDWELMLSSDDVHSALQEIQKSLEWSAALPNLFSDVDLLLRDALDIMRELGSADDHSDLSYIYQPSISEHSQNQDLHDWTALIELTRDAWVGLSTTLPGRARLIAEQWLQVPFPLFKRLAFFAATHVEIIPKQVALSWLLTDGCWWLWSVETQRETIRLLVLISPLLDAPDLASLEKIILHGPPRKMFKDNLEPQDWERIVDREIWLRLSKMSSAGASLGKEAEAKRTELSAKYSQWQIEADESDEFPFWMGDGDEGRKFVATPRRRRELAEWLKQHPTTDPWQEDDWKQRCRNEFARSACALCALTREDVWPVDRWRQALQAWAEENLVRRSWRYMAPVLFQATDKVINELVHSLSWWLETTAKTFEGKADLLFALCQRVLDLELSDKDAVENGDPVGRAINHPVGHVTEALLRWWYRQSPEDNQGLPAELSTILTRLCSSQIPAHRHARVILAAHVIPLLRVDPEWTKRNLLPNFSWSRSQDEARAAWEGFLWSPRLYGQLFELIKTEFLETARYYQYLGNHSKQYAAFLTFASLEPRDIFTISELRSATEELPEEGRQEAVNTLVRALQSAGDQKAEYLLNRILPYWKSIWPKSHAYRTPPISGALARLCIAAGEAFPVALKVFGPWLQPIEHPQSMIQHLDKKGLAKNFPEEALSFLNTIIGVNSPWLPSSLKNCLDQIKESKAELENNVQFNQLLDYLRRQGKA